MAVRENPIPIRPLYCTCRGASPGPVAACPVHGTAFQTDITTANNLIAEWVSSPPASPGSASGALRVNASSPAWAWPSATSTA